MSEILVTPDGLERHRAKLAELQDQLKGIRAEKAVAYTASGDNWHDNPGFNKLEADERALARRIAEQQTLVRGARIFHPPVRRQTDKVRLGAIVEFRRLYMDTSEPPMQAVIEISGYNETDLEHGKVGYNTPLAMSLLGLKLGEGRESTTPKGRAKFDVIVLYTSWDDVPEDLRNNPLLSGKPEE